MIYKSKFDDKLIKTREDLTAGVQYVPEIWVGWGDGTNWDGGRGQDVSGNRK